MRESLNGLRMLHFKIYVLILHIEIGDVVCDVHPYLLSRG